MTGQESRYDRIAEGYATYWSPVHRKATLRLLDEVPREADAAGARIVEVGCGTAAMAAAAAARWPGAEIDATDVAAGMLALARETLDAAGEAGRRVRLTRAPADQLPFADGSFNLALAAFVLQLVPSRPRALREMRRGGGRRRRPAPARR